MSKKKQIDQGESGFLDFGYLKFDHRRTERVGFPEAIYAPSKTPQQILETVRRLLDSQESKHLVLVTRIENDLAKKVLLLDSRRIRHNEQARAMAINPRQRPLRSLTKSVPTIAIVTAGTGDIPVAEEAAFVCESLGHSVIRLFDVGVAGLHRLMKYEKIFKNLSCAVVCAGMEGALPSVVGGLCACPVIGVPVSVGYGVAATGRVALEAMLSSCASNVSVVNIDNGFSAGIIAHLMASQSRKKIFKIKKLSRKTQN